MFRPLLLLLAGLWLGPNVAAQPRTLTGLITATDDQKPLAGATVALKGTTAGVMTGPDGRFRLELPTTSRPAGAAATTLLVSFVGYATREVLVDDQTTNVVVALEPAASDLNETVITATRQPVRKLETTTAIDFIQARELQDRTPITFADAIRYVPGIYTQTSSGRYGGQILVRGFPDGAGNGLVYTSLLLDGLPSFASPARPVDEFFKYDLNIERIEVVRGSAATLFGRSSAAGVVNLITRTGGPRLGGTVQFSHYSNVFGAGLNPRIDVNVNGPLAKNVRFNAGGFWLNDAGFRNSGYPDKGGQFRANVDFLLPRNSSIRLFGMYTNTTSQNNTDIPFALATQTVAPGWNAADTYYTPAFDGVQYRVTRPDNTTALRNAGDVFPTGNYARGYQIGFNVDLNLGAGFTLVNRFRRQDVDTGLKYTLGISTYFTLTPPASATALNPTQTRLLLDGDARNVDHINEIRLQKLASIGGSRHQFSLGNYFSTVRLRPEYYQFAYTPDIVPRGRIAPFPFIPPGLARYGRYTEQTLSFFGGDEIKVNNRLTVNLGARYDIVDLNLLDVLGPVSIPRRTRDPLLPTYVENTRRVNISDWSASLGLNYLTGPNSAVYGNVVRAFRAPDYSVFTQVRRQPVAETRVINGVSTNLWTYSPTAPYTLFPNGLERNETVLNTEVGYRTTAGSLSIDVAGFRTAISNRLASTFIDGQAVVLPLGNNLILGGEATLTLVPRQLKGLLLRTTLTLQNARFTDFRIATSTTPVTVITPAGSTTATVVNPNGELYGNTLVRESGGTTSALFLDLRDNRLPGVPNLIWNVVATYTHRRFGLDARLNYVGRRYQDPTNIIAFKPQVFVETGASLTFFRQLRLRVNVQNLLNEDTLMRQLGNEADQALIQKQVNPTFANVYVAGFPMMPRRVIYSLSYTL